MDLVPGRDGGCDAAAAEAVAVPGAPGEAEAMEQRVGLAPRRWSRPLRVLLALAEAQACDTAGSYLELGTGFAVVGTAPNGHRALALAAEVEPDVAVVDAHLPAGGLAVIPALRKRSPGTVVVALASRMDLLQALSASETRAAEAAVVGADVYLERATPLLVLTDVLADLAVRLDQDSRRTLREQWPAHVPLPVARWAESVRGGELHLVRSARNRGRPAGRAATRLGGGSGRPGRSRSTARSARVAVRPPRRWTVGIAAAAAAGSLLSAGVAAAATGSLPAPAQALASRALANLHVEVPNPEARRSGAGSGHAAGGRGPAPGGPAVASGTRMSPGGSPSGAGGRLPGRADALIALISRS